MTQKVIPNLFEEDSEHRLVTDLQIVRWDSKQSALGFMPENPANKGKATGYASLGADGKVPLSQLPPISGGGGASITPGLSNQIFSMDSTGTLQVWKSLVIDNTNTYPMFTFEDSIITLSIPSASDIGVSSGLISHSTYSQISDHEDRIVTLEAMDYDDRITALENKHIISPDLPNNTTGTNGTIWFRYSP